MYPATFGIVPYFKLLGVREVFRQAGYVMILDKHLNKALQNPVWMQKIIFKPGINNFTIQHNSSAINFAPNSSIHTIVEYKDPKLAKDNEKLSHKLHI